MPTLGKFIKRRRIELGLTQEALAAEVGDGVRQSEISRLESDRIVLPRRERLERLALALDVPLGELLARSGWTGADDGVAEVLISSSAVIVTSEPPITTDHPASVIDMLNQVKSLVEQVEQMIESPETPLVDVSKNGDSPQESVSQQVAEPLA